MQLSPFTRQCFVTSAVACNIIGHGCAVGFPAIFLPQISRPDSPIPITMEQGSWITSVLSFSLLAGSFMTPPISGRFGRKMAHYAVTIPILLSWFLMILSTNVQGLIIARILQGISLGMLLPLRSVLIGEYTSPRNRGAFLATVSLSQALGVFFVHLFGSIMYWQRAALLCGFFSFTSLVLTIYSPESPSYLASRGKYEECRRSFHWLRGYDEEEELERLIEACRVRKTEQTGNVTFRELSQVCRDKLFYKPILIMLHAYIMSQIGGGTIMASYANTIIGSTVGPEASIHFWMVALDAQRIISNSGAVYVINKIPRRIMMLSTGILSVVSHLCISLYVYLKSMDKLYYDSTWIPILLLNLQVFTIAVGMVPVPSVIAGEVFPLKYRNIGGTISMVPLTITMFITLKTFPFLVQGVGLHGTFTTYACVISYCVIMMWFLLPETKDKTLQEIEDEIRGRPLKIEEVEVTKELQSSCKS